MHNLSIIISQGCRRLLLILAPHGSSMCVVVCDCISVCVSVGWCRDSLCWCVHVCCVVCLVSVCVSVAWGKSRRFADPHVGRCCDSNTSTARWVSQSHHIVSISSLYLIMHLTFTPKTASSPSTSTISTLSSALIPPKWHPDPISRFATVHPPYRQMALATSLYHHPLMLYWLYSDVANNVHSRVTINFYNHWSTLYSPKTRPLLYFQLQQIVLEVIWKCNGSTEINLSCSINALFISLYIVRR